MRADVHRGPNDVNHRKLARALAARSTSEAVGPERRQRPSSDLRRSPAPAKDRPSRATRLLASESTPRGDILALQPVHRSRWTACRRGSAAPPTMVLEENVRVSGVSPPAQRGGKPGSGKHPWRAQLQSLDALSLSLAIDSFAWLCAPTRTPKQVPRRFESLLIALAADPELSCAQHTHGPRPASRRPWTQRIRDRYPRREA